MSEPQFEILAADEIDALTLGAAVKEGELDATVRTHPLVPPGQAILINRDKLLAWNDLPPVNWRGQ